jgi:DNA-binding XRE family transcriptional regulator
VPAGDGHHYRNAPAHRVAWELAYGAIPPGMEVARACPGGANPLCVRPDHLILREKGAARRATQRERAPHGYTAKLTPEQVRYAYERRGKHSQRHLADDLGVARTTIAHIHERRTWGTLTRDLSAGDARDGNAKLTPDQVRYAYEMRGKKSPRQLGEELGVSPDAIRDIHQRKTWVTLTRDLIADEARCLNRKLTPEQVRYAYEMRGKKTQRRLGEELGVHIQTIKAIHRRQSWARLTSDLVTNELVPVPATVGSSHEREEDGL